VARQLGADAVVEVEREDVVDRVRAVTGGEMADVVLDMSHGSTEPVLQAVEVARPGARIVLAGLKSGKPLSGLVTDRIVVKELQILGGFASTAHSLDIALEILQQRYADLAVMCSHVYPLAQADMAVRALGREIDDGRDVVHVNFNMTGAVRAARD
jgi:threonine dehydrogenase-like Zn-dependent dehydrogenase